MKDVILIALFVSILDFLFMLLGFYLCERTIQLKENKSNKSIREYIKGIKYSTDEKAIVPED